MAAHSARWAKSGARLRPRSLISYSTRGFYHLTGPALSTPRQRAEAIGDALGEPIRFIEQTRDEAHAQMLRFMPEPVVETTLDAIGEPNPAEQRISPDVERVLGRAPRTFADWVQRHIAAFR